MDQAGKPFSKPARKSTNTMATVKVKTMINAAGRTQYPMINKIPQRSSAYTARYALVNEKGM